MRSYQIHKIYRKVIHTQEQLDLSLPQKEHMANGECQAKLQANNDTATAQRTEIEELIKPIRKELDLLNFEILEKKLPPLSSHKAVYVPQEDIRDISIENKLKDLSIIIHKKSNEIYDEISNLLITRSAIQTRKMLIRFSLIILGLLLIIGSLYVNK